jgi:predicted O-methyltransferase YrrM
MSSNAPLDQWLAEIEALKNELAASRRDTFDYLQKWRAAVEQLERLEQPQHPASTDSNPLWVAPGHFYSPIPDVDDLKAHQKEIFTIPQVLPGVDLNEKEQLELLEEFKALYQHQPFIADPHPDRRYFFENRNYSYSDAIILYCMMRHLRPRRIVEIGSGYSSCAMLDVNELFFENSIACTFIDPYPQLLKRLIKESDVSRIRIVGEKVQDVDLNVFRELSASDILFVDSSHVTKTGSDVNYIMFEVLPLLAPGVHIHFHDILYPFEYPAEWVFEGRAWNEAYLLRAFLQYNSAFKIRFFTTYLILKYRQVFESDFPLCLKNSGGNLWLEKKSSGTTT